MKFKKLSALLACAMLLMVPVQGNVTAVDETTAPNAASSEDAQSVARAAGLISTYTLSCSASTKTLYITGATRGTGKMAEIGFINIDVQKSTDKKSWSHATTVVNQIATNSDYKSMSNFAVPLKGGYYYRVSLTHYAKETGWFPDEQSVSNTSNAVWVPAS